MVGVGLIILEILKLISIVIFSFLQSIFHLFIPKTAKNVTDQVVLITGAGSGIGRLLALELSKKGCVVLLLDINLKSIEETASMIRDAKGKSYKYVCDLSIKHNIYDTLNKISKEIGDIDILINNAGVVSGKNLLDATDDHIVKTININLMAHFWLIRGVLPSMIARNQGHIISIASVAGLFGTNKLTDYCSSKFAVVGLNESLTQEIISANKTGVKTTCVCPYYINTGMFQGVKPKFPSILPILEPDYVCSEIVKAILTNQEILFLPKIIHCFIIMKAIVPTKAYHAVCDFFEVNKDLNSFVGRRDFF